MPSEWPLATTPERKCAVTVLRPRAWFAALPLLLALPTAPAQAGMDCKLARTPTEKTLCADPALYRLDEELGATYARLRAALPGQRDALRQSQRDWLKQRDLCGADGDCLRQRYEARAAELQGQLRRAQGYQPDATDRLALQDLRQAVAAARLKDPEMPLETALAALSVKAEATTFANVRAADGDDPARLPAERPPGVTEDEWRAVLASGLDGDSDAEGGNVSYTLLDLDGDGRRDLVVDTYIGGTGLFSDIGVLRRDGARFAPADANGAPDAGGSLYTINGRGANQSGDWIRLRGRIYATYRVGAYGEDRLYLLRPLYRAGDVPTLTVRYHYDLSVPRQQKRPDTNAPRTLDDTLHAALSHALAGLPAGPAKGDAPGDEPLCPVPAGTSLDQRETYNGYGPGHYSYETVGDLTVRIGARCYVGRVVDWFGDYSAKNGLSAQLWIRDPDDPAGKQDAFDLRGKRRAVDIETSIGPVQGDNGV